MQQSVTLPSGDRDTFLNFDFSGKGRRIIAAVGFEASRAGHTNVHISTVKRDGMVVNVAIASNRPAETGIAIGCIAFVQP